MDYSCKLIGITLGNGLVIMGTSGHTNGEGVTINGPVIADMFQIPAEPVEEGVEQKPSSTHINYSSMSSRTIPWSRVLFIDVYNPSTLDGNLKKVYSQLSGIILN